MYNINKGKNSEILKKCETLREYSSFVEKVRGAQESGELTQSRMAEIIGQCISEGILPEFLKKYGTEMVEMLFRELTREEDMEISRLDGYDDGYDDGLEDGRKQGLTDGEAAATYKMARAMKADGETKDRIMKYTGLPLEEIDKL